MTNEATVLNRICPYFTMFPLDFLLNILKRKAHAERFLGYITTQCPRISTKSDFPEMI